MRLAAGEGGVKPTREVQTLNVTELVAQLGETRAQVLLRALKCQTAEELVDLARENGLSVSQEEAGELFSLLAARRDELSDAELDAVTGGSGKSSRECLCGGTIQPTDPPEYHPVHGAHIYRCTKCGLEGFPG
jgi:hypothetical protein